VIPAVTAGFCAACEESITDLAETDRVMREMLVFNKQTAGL
jgi:HTH-type transcriptional regulator/antitoxin MqsA